jgi:Putative lumazine-binding
MDEGKIDVDVAAVAEVVRLYYEGMVSGDRAKLTRAFHPRACIVGNEGGELTWATVEEFAAECEAGVGQTGERAWQIDGLSFAGDTALVRLGNSYAGIWYSDDLSMVRVDGDWRIVHKTFYPHPRNKVLRSPA